MNDDIKNSVNQPLGHGEEACFKERSLFKGLLLTNPNYFGNLEKSELQPVLQIVGDTYYEELACVGYYPQQKYLEAVVYTYQSSGYGTGVCGSGTSEYVRFYLSYDDGSSWEDQGLTSFRAYNIPFDDDTERSRLEYAVSLKVDPRRRFCFSSPLIQVRAVLSWNFPPPPNDPNWNPVWGNVKDAVIQVEPYRLIPFPLFLGEANLQLPGQLTEIIDPSTEIKTQLKPSNITDLANIYQEKEVPISRFAYNHLSSFIAENTTATLNQIKFLIPGIEITPEIIDDLVTQTDGDTSFEELKCIGLDPNTPNTLVGILKIKKNSGFSGGPCTEGSKEYVTFWGDFNSNGTFETCLGTASVQVYDMDIPDEGVYYAVRLPVDLSRYQEVCTEGPTLIRIRAILSWQVPAPCFNPDYIPRWGNREETAIHISPLQSAPAGKIAIIGGIPVQHIDNVTGVTTSTAIFATNNLQPDSLGRPCPFGRRVSIHGAPLPGQSYKIEVIAEGTSAPIPIVEDLIVTNASGVTSTHRADPVTGRFDYLPFEQNINGLLGLWISEGNKKWLVRLTTYNATGIPTGIDLHYIQLKNNGPEASIEITTGSGDCGKFSVGTLLEGRFVARDDVLSTSYLNGYNLSVEPNVNGKGVGEPVPKEGLFNTAPAPGDNWKLDTKDMKSCGYIIKVRAIDRTIINSQRVGLEAADSAGFCLEEE